VSHFTDTALKFPCYFAVETVQPRFAHRLALGSLILTVNSGYE
jgi:hypothetical protein